MLHTGREKISAYEQLVIVWKVYFIKNVLTNENRLIYTVFRKMLYFVNVMHAQCAHLG